MNQYQHLVQELEQLQIEIQPCHKDQIISHDRSVAYDILQRSNIIMQHDHIADQKIYFFVQAGAIVRCQSFGTIKDPEIKRNLEFIILVEQDAQFVLDLLFLYAATVHCTIRIYLMGDRSRAEVKGMYALWQTHQLTITSYQIHEGADSFSDVVFKGTLQDNASVNYHGLIKIAESGKGTSASQEHKNIVLSPGAKVISVPTIEVLQHDVQCCHGSAVGKFMDQHLWYLRSKGLTAAKAQELLIKSFFSDIVERFDHSERIMDSICQTMIQK